ncbi:MAG: hypothetical protein EOO49_05385 [Flavobacterium sp.]|nr:MAG: hypothetical protein EOO49_05385 [Flavobacterium sp.]
MTCREAATAVKYTFMLSLLLVSQRNLNAQNFKLMRFDEDYTHLKDSSRTPYEKIKYFRLSQNGLHYLSFGGEIRQEVDNSHNEDWGRFGAGAQTYVLQRYQLHTDIHFGTRSRLFVQLRSGLEDGRKMGPRPIDEDRLNVQNLFLDIIPYKDSANTLTVRLGRQELQYGSGRILDVRDGPNLRLYFDGAKIAFASAKLKLDAFVMASPAVRKGLFDNSATRKANLWGVYGTQAVGSSTNLDVYYLGISRDTPFFDEGTAKEIRHTFGARLWRKGKGFTYNFEAGYQSGKFGNGQISAFGVSSEIGYQFDRLWGKPAFKLRNDIISGDKRRDDGNLQTFNALYPNGGYFGMNPQLGPANLVSIHPNFSCNFSPRLSMSLEALFGWRQSIHDGVYTPGGMLNLSGAGSDRRYIGTSYITTASFRFNDFVNLGLGLQYFQTGAFIDESVQNHKDGFFVGSVLSFRF